MRRRNFTQQIAGSVAGNKICHASNRQMFVLSLFSRMMSAAYVTMMFAAITTQPSTAQPAAQLPIVEEIVRSTFASFKAAVLARDGTGAAQLMDDGTIALHEKFRRLALSAPKPTLLKERFHIITGVLSVRHNFKKEEIQKIDGREMYALSITRGDAGAANAIPLLNIVKVTPDRNGQSAVAELGMEGRSDTIGIKFFRQQSRWKIDFKSLTDGVAAETEERIGITSRTPPDVMESVIDRLLLPVLAGQSKRQVSPDIWLPLNRPN